jgi:hypothetical protein
LPWVLTRFEDVYLQPLAKTEGMGKGYAELYLFASGFIQRIVNLF